MRASAASRRERASRRAVALVGAVVAVVVTATACGPADKQRATRQIAAGAKRSELRHGRVSLSTKVVDMALPSAATQALPNGGRMNAAAAAQLLGAAPGSAKAAAADLDLVLDPAHRRAALLAPASAAARVGPTPSGGRPALVLFDHDTIYVRRADLTTVGARQWYRLDTRQIVSLGTPTAAVLAAPRTLADLAVLNPVDVVQQAVGMLTGSLHDGGAETLAGPSGGGSVTAHHYSGRTSLDKVTRQFHRDADSKKPWQRLLRIFAAKDDINPIAVWTGQDGRLDRLDLTYVGRPARRTRIDVTYSVVLAPSEPAPAPADLEVLTPPPGSDVVEVSSLAQIRGALGQWGVTAAPPDPSAGGGQ